MANIYYNLKFSGLVSPVEGKPGTFQALGGADSNDISCTIGSGGVKGKVSPGTGGSATFESVVVVTGKDTFDEKGKITFGKSGKHGFSFATVGAGSYGAGPAKGGMHGAVTWRITRAFGQFKGAKGYITSNFAVDGKGRLTDHQIGNFNKK
ncbi:MAG: hypothetical protein O3B21_14010 [Proteobacteria bacterium]|nr:hypothetical protein [Pseudomonadota bacterium]MDA1356445.1 hypothetical protein [Pseudomonadota bacterium]